jgi:hypothetical protein
MSTEMDLLKERLRELVGVLNEYHKEKWPQLEPLLDSDVAMKRIDDTKKNQLYHKGKNAVKHYFETNGTTDKAVFTTERDPDFEVVRDLGFVSGTATFIDRTVPTRTRPRRIAYSFTFTRIGGAWVATHLWGQYI